MPFPSSYIIDVGTAAVMRLDRPVLCSYGCWYLLTDCGSRADVWDGCSACNGWIIWWRGQKHARVIGYKMTKYIVLLICHLSPSQSCLRSTSSMSLLRRVSYPSFSIITSTLWCGFVPAPDPISPSTPGLLSALHRFYHKPNRSKRKRKYRIKRTCKLWRQVDILKPLLAT